MALKRAISTQSPWAQSPSTLQLPMPALNLMRYHSEGKSGYFSQKLHVYGRAGLPCMACGSILQLIQLGKRSTVFCEHCQLPPL